MPETRIYNTSEYKQGFNIQVKMLQAILAANCSPKTILKRWVNFFI